MKSPALIGLSKHKNLKKLHLGHFEHGDSQCNLEISENPPKGMFLEALFSKKENFPKLYLIYLEQNCALSFWFDVRLKRLRPNITIKFSALEQSFFE